MKLLKEIQYWWMRHKVSEVVKQTDLVSPERNPLFVKYVPHMHHYRKIMQYVGGYGHLSRLYCKTILKHYNGKLPFEIERAVILKAHINMMYNLTDAGHQWSEKAQKLMKEKQPMTYEHLILCERN